MFDGIAIIRVTVRYTAAAVPKRIYKLLICVTFVHCPAFNAKLYLSLCYREHVKKGRVLLADVSAKALTPPLAVKLADIFFLYTFFYMYKYIFLN